MPYKFTMGLTPKGDDFAPLVAHFENLAFQADCKADVIHVQRLKNLARREAVIWRAAAQILRCTTIEDLGPDPLGDWHGRNE